MDRVERYEARDNAGAGLGDHQVPDLIGFVKRQLAVEKIGGTTSFKCTHLVFAKHGVGEERQ